MLHIRPMAAGDLPLGMRLKDQAGWNQTEADWQRLLALQPDGCFVAELDGRPVGTACACAFDTVGWLAMVLVDEAARRRGIATQLVRHALEHLDRLGVSTFRLDATPLSRPLYEKFGFRMEYALARMEGTIEVGGAGPCVGAAAYSVTAATAGQLDAIVALDHALSGTDRRRLIERMFAERPDAVLVATVDQSTAGYLAFRPGSRAVQIGPAVAYSAEAGRALAEASLARWAGLRVFVDIPLENAAALVWAARRGLRTQRVFTRMCRGQSVRDRPDLIWASSGPEKG